MNIGQKIKSLPLDKYTIDRLQNALITAKESKAKTHITKLIESEKTFATQNTNQVLELLNYAHLQTPPLDSVYPSVVADFLKYKIRHRRDKVDFVAIYGKMLNLSHTITFLNKSNETAMIDSYNEKWKKSQIDFFQMQKPYNRMEMESTPMNKILQLNFSCETPFAENVQQVSSDDIQKLVHLRQQYNSKLKLKISPPYLKLEINPDRFGEPIVPSRIFNIRVNRLLKLQQFYLKNQPISAEGMEFFNNMDVVGLDGLVREAYVTFLDNIFTIDENCNIQKSNIASKRLEMSENIKHLYELAKV